MDCTHYKRRRFKCQRLWSSLGLLLGAAFLTGCGDGLARVSGNLSLDGQPLRAQPGKVRVSVRFQPESGVGPVAVGLADENGYYTLGTGSQTGILPGDYVVTCSASEVLTNSKSLARELTDPKYGNPKTSGLRFTVQPGKNQFDIPLTSSPKTARRPRA
jgi:hypothetical protein